MGRLPLLGMRSAAALLVTVAVGVGGLAPSASASTPAAAATPAINTLEPAQRAFDYYSSAYNRVHTRRSSGWLWGTYAQGAENLYRATGSQKYLRDALAWGRANNWAVAAPYTQPDNTKAITVYDDLAQDAPKSVNLGPTNSVMATNLATLDNADYSWIDTLFMGMGNWSRAATRTGNNAYLAKMDALYTSTRDTACGNGVGMYNPSAGLWYRDCSFVGQTDVHGKPIYWSRGNGWVLAGLAETLQTLPRNASDRGMYVSMLQTMAAALVPLQGSDGMWRASLADPSLFPDAETSGTALFTYALAYGISAGILDPVLYLPVVRRAWIGLSTIAVQPSGFVSHCQAPDNQPHAPFTGRSPAIAGTSTSAGSLFTNSSPYCVGAVMMAAAAAAPLLKVSVSWGTRIHSSGRW